MSNDNKKGINNYWDPTFIVDSITTFFPNLSQEEARSIVIAAVNKIKQDSTVECCQYYKVVNSVQSMAKPRRRQ